MNTAAIICQAFGESLNSGTHRCCYCGGPCDDSLPAAITDGWTDYGSLRAPASPYRCRGCDLSFQVEADVRFPDGTQPEPGKRMVWAIRLYSWIVTPRGAIAYSPRHRMVLREHLLSPPSVPYVACVTTSGQRHYLWQTPACVDAGQLVCSIDGVPVVSTPEAFLERLQLFERLIAAIGKPALSETLGARREMRVIEQWGEVGEDYLQAWERTRAEPLSDLALYLARGKDECLADDQLR